MSVEREQRLASLIEILGHVAAGKATVSVGGRPLVSVDADKKTLDVEVEGVGEAGLHLSDLIKLEEGRGGMIEGSMHVTGALSRVGWRLSLYAEGDRVLSMGSGMSRLTGRISVNPLKLRKLLRAIK
ncbi:MAG TPA: hypothetical protein VEB87_04050 [Nitrososphaerales archaeon]|nr:hypothetical protein [Nitrososphaerales archaeon]